MSFKRTMTAQLPNGHLTTSDPDPKTKAIICCFDGTGNKFGEENSNVVRFFSALIKDKPEKQVVYYQPGIGTYSNHQYYTKTASTISTNLDQAIAWYLNDHVKEGYKFIMQHYKTGDKICLFGFSRGAYTARVLMGMLYKVGLLPQDNIQQVDFAFSVYEMTGDKGRELSREFKRTFAIPVTVEFVGVWDTVSSVGLYPRSNRHPYTSVNYATKYFRHALALDERRIRFRAQTWHETTTEREQELDVDEPQFSNDAHGDYTPPERNIADVKEVWFSGCHADIGGGSHHNRLRNSLSYIPLRWMFREVDAAKCGIIFDEKRKDDYMRESLPPSNETTPAQDAMITQGVMNGHSAHGRILPRYASDIFSTLFDQLVLVWYFWWLLEALPLLTTYQTVDGDWIRRKVRNLGDGRHIPFHDGSVLVHDSVKNRIEQFKGTNEAYEPQAVNWKALEKTGMIKYTTDIEP